MHDQIEFAIYSYQIHYKEKHYNKKLIIFHFVMNFSVINLRKMSQGTSSIYDIDKIA